MDWLYILFGIYNSKVPVITMLNMSIEKLLYSILILEKINFMFHLIIWISMYLLITN